jgi:FtsH-binding integral membrane protein
MQNYSENKILNTEVNESENSLSRFFQKTYALMAIALLVTAGTAYLLSHVFLTQYVNFMNSFNTIGWIALIGLQLLVVFLIGRQSFKNPAMAFALLLIFGVVEGIVFGGLFLSFTSASIASTFVITAADFGAMALYGVFSKKNMSKMGPILFGAVIALIVASLINIFLHSSMLMWITSIIAIVVFSLYTMYDNNQLKRQFYQLQSSGVEDSTGLAVNGALRLYLDFINIFVNLLQIFGNRN